MKYDWQAVTREPDLLGESPFWHPQERTLYWVDIPARKVKRLGAEGGTQMWDMPSEPGCIAPVESGGFVIALRDGVYRASAWHGPLQLVVRFNHDPATMRFNDGKADPEGRFWAGTMYEPRDLRRAELYCIDLRSDNGSGGQPVVHLKAHNAIIANGLAWSPDSKTMYWSDTPHHIIHTWDWDAHANAMHNYRVFREFAPKPQGWTPGAPGYGGRPDGAAVDSLGNYWSAMFEGQRLVKFSAVGEILEEIEVPLRCPTMPCFGGDDLRTLYVTSSREKRPADEVRALPLSGHVIAARVDVPGLPVNFVRT
ncbi:MAG TPA: SMP-30/gluconolactonase/LRE family protein [Ramlibacter sp.]|nr:SMP-30/gluconolactonase/LRE family protein [Ramlibacter sp.]